jgi:hypothetical protein
MTCIHLGFDCHPQTRTDAQGNVTHDCDDCPDYQEEWVKCPRCGLTYHITVDHECPTQAQLDAQEDYYQERILIDATRLDLLAITSACILALKHPELPDTVRQMLSAALPQILPMISEYMPDAILQEWCQITQGGPYGHQL